MIVHPLTDELLEKLWYFEEDGREARDASDLRLQADSDSVDSVVDQLVSTGAIARDGKLRLLESGSQRARGIVRRHRLAEILFTEVLEAEASEAEASACEFEHMLSESVVDRVCAFLGHPPKCPHNKPIPRGVCCSKFEKKIEPLITRLYDLSIGGAGKIVFIAPKSPSRLNRLATLGVVPGTSVRLMQRKPSIVIRCGETAIAIEDEVAHEIYVRPEESRR